MSLEASASASASASATATATATAGPAVLTSVLCAAVRSGHRAVLHHLIAAKGVDVNQYSAAATFGVLSACSAQPLDPDWVETPTAASASAAASAASSAAPALSAVFGPTTALLTAVMCAPRHVRLPSALSTAASASTAAAQPQPQPAAEAEVEEELSAEWMLATAGSGSAPTSSAALGLGLGLASSLLIELRTAFPAIAALLEAGAHPAVVIQHSAETAAASASPHNHSHSHLPLVSSALGFAAREAPLFPVVGLLACAGAPWAHCDRALGFTAAALHAYRLGKSLPLLLEVEKELWRSSRLSLTLIRLVLQWCVLTEAECGLEHHRMAHHVCALTPASASSPHH